jgi:hypothetical protein
MIIPDDDVGAVGRGLVAQGLLVVLGIDATTSVFTIDFGRSLVRWMGFYARCFGGRGRRSWKEQ